MSNRRKAQEAQVDRLAADLEPVIAAAIEADRLAPPGQRAPTTLPREMSEAVRMGREIFERAWVYAVSIDSPDELTLDDAGRKVADLVRDLLQAQMEADCAAACVLCGGYSIGADRWVLPASLPPGPLEGVQIWSHIWGLGDKPTAPGAQMRGYLPCSAMKIREAWRMGIWADAIK